MTAVLAIVGAGPRGTGLLERLAANARLLPSGGCEIHVVDPHPAGAGRVWRPDQSELLLMNSRAGDVTMFTDRSVRCAGPITPGPTLAEWAGVGDDAFASRRLGGAYLTWCFDRAVNAFPSDVRVVVHRTSAVALSDGSRQTITLADGSHVVADVVVLAQGNVGGHRDEQQRAHQEHAARTGGTYLPPSCPGDEDLDLLPPGERVLVSGLGLAFVDLAVLLTEGRGGRFTRSRDGVLSYRPSGREPVLHAGSRRGVPYLPKPLLPPVTDPAPRFFTPDLLATATPGELVGAACRELVWAHYRELFAAHRDRTRLSWRTFAAEFAAVDVTDPALEALVARAVPAPQDRADVSFLRSPLAGRTFADQTELGSWMGDHLGRTVARATDPRHSAHAAVLHGLLTVSEVLEQQTAPTPAAGRAAAMLSRFAAYLGSGPPPHRLEQLGALSRAGILRFLGADLRVDHAADAFRARTASLPSPVTARHLVEARLPDPDARAHPLLENLTHERLRVPVDPDTFQVLDRAGSPHPRRLALGLFAGGGALGAFSRPGRDAPFFRQNDETARRVLTELGALVTAGV